MPPHDAPGGHHQLQHRRPPHPQLRGLLLGPLLNTGPAADPDYCRVSPAGGLQLSNGMNITWHDWDQLYLYLDITDHTAWSQEKPSCWYYNDISRLEILSGVSGSWVAGGRPPLCVTDVYQDCICICVCGPTLGEAQLGKWSSKRVTGVLLIDQEKTSKCIEILFRYLVI